MDEFWVLFLPILGLGLLFLGLGTLYPINFLVNIVLIVLGCVCFAIDIFAALVQYVNWKYYKEK